MVTGPYAAGETVTVLRRAAAGPDADGNDAWTTVEQEVPGCAVWPRGSSELVQGQDTVIVGLQVLLPAGTQVSATDRLRVRGAVYEVEGESGAWAAPWGGWPGGVEVALTRATG
jgi:hypothetical protein